MGTKAIWRVQALVLLPLSSLCPPRGRSVEGRTFLFININWAVFLEWPKEELWLGLSSTLPPNSPQHKLFPSHMQKTDQLFSNNSFGSQMRGEEPWLS